MLRVGLGMLCVGLGMLCVGLGMLCVGLGMLCVGLGMLCVGLGVAERTIRTMKEECIWLHDWRSLAALQQALQEWARTFNHDRPHQALGWQTPAERREQHLGPPQRKAA